MLITRAVHILKPFKHKFLQFGFLHWTFESSITRLTLLQQASSKYTRSIVLKLTLLSESRCDDLSMTCSSSHVIRWGAWLFLACLDFLPPNLVSLLAI
jgi:hypothetical protein